MKQWICCALALLSAGAALAAPAASPGTGSREPVEITADRMEADDVAKTVIFIGNAVARQGDITMTGDRLTIHAPPQGGDVERVLAEGNVRIVQGQRVATGQRAEYFRAEERIVLTGSPRVSEGGTRCRGTRSWSSSRRTAAWSRGARTAGSTPCSSRRGRACVDPSPDSPRTVQDATSVARWSLPSTSRWRPARSSACSARTAPARPPRFTWWSAWCARTAGQVCLDDQRSHQVPMHQRARLGISYLAQEPSVFRKPDRGAEPAGDSGNGRERIRRSVSSARSNCSRSSACSMSPAVTAMPCRVASAGAPRWPGPWCSNRASCCSMSRSPGSIRSPCSISRRSSPAEGARHRRADLRPQRARDTGCLRPRLYPQRGTHPRRGRPGSDCRQPAGAGDLSRRQVPPVAVKRNPWPWRSANNSSSASSW